MLLPCEYFVSVCLKGQYRGPGVFVHAPLSCQILGPREKTSEIINKIKYIMGGAPLACQILGPREKTSEIINKIKFIMCGAFLKSAIKCRHFKTAIR